MSILQQYLQILERFEIALTLDDERILIPSMLPRDRPGFLLRSMQQQISNRTSKTKPISRLTSIPRGTPNTFSTINLEYICRNYHLFYVPSGLWSRLIGELHRFYNFFLCKAGVSAVGRWWKLGS